MPKLYGIIILHVSASLYELNLLDPDKSLGLSLTGTCWRNQGSSESIRTKETTMSSTNYLEERIAI